MDLEPKLTETGHPRSQEPKEQTIFIRPRTVNNGSYELCMSRPQGSPSSGYRHLPDLSDLSVMTRHQVCSAGMYDESV
jgi:hypothetical protein